MHEHHKEIAVLYHGGCPDGFGGAYAAWKKFGDTAEYIPVKYGNPIPEGLAGRNVYLIDFCYDEKADMNALAGIAKSLTVLDHHKGAEQVVRSFPGVFDANHSGATIAWSYFHPETPVPRLMKYLEDGDLYRYVLPETRDIFSYLLVLPSEFLAWDEFALGLENGAARATILKKAAAYTEFFESLARSSVERAKKVRFEGYEVYFVATHPSITMKSYVGHELYEKLPPFALIVTAHPNGFGVSIRGNGTVDVAKIAEKYGGGGHPGSAGFFVGNGETMPWTEIDE